ncbi:hypothetical protein PHLGIDRAFT_123474 [Phlebiopsis gigantea 11061_1 CR5-6]|uniref:Uncharacterized protein n=1 Tax=Phlebiopsis gigantea (strain 11061_1 CR5-6) TaxID=745531 RepID=A0A0C3RYL1_PHLG1|nr:hypothetical protein PHLGIDRAFT_123474 [Phlebiopsis gigantea 11061_1 CR5-6]
MDEEQFAYRDALHAFAGAAGLEVPAWVVEVYRTRDVLRAAWRELVRTGEDGEWVRGVGRAGGEEGQQQWVDMMGRLSEKSRRAQADARRMATNSFKMSIG